MAVALYTGKSSTHQALPGCVHPVQHRSRSEFFILCTAFIIRHGIAVKSGGNIIIVGGVGQQITGELLC